MKIYIAGPVAGIPGLEATAERRRRVLSRRAQYIRKTLPPRDGATYAHDRASAELAAIRWALRVVDENWDSAIALARRPADSDPEEDQ